MHSWRKVNTITDDAIVIHGRSGVNDNVRTYHSIAVDDSTRHLHALASHDTDGDAMAVKIPAAASGYTSSLCAA